MKHCRKDSLQHAGSFPCPTALIRSKTVSAGRVASRGGALSAPPQQVCTEPDLAAACCNPWRNPWHVSVPCSSLLQPLAPSQTLQQPAATLGTNHALQPPARPCSSLLQPLAPSQTLQQPAATLGTEPNLAAACCNPRHPATPCSSRLQPLAVSHTLQQPAANSGT